MSVFGSIVSAIFGSKHASECCSCPRRNCGTALISGHHGICGRGTNNGRFSQFIDYHPYLKSRR